MNIILAFVLVLLLGLLTLVSYVDRVYQVNYAAADKAAATVALDRHWWKLFMTRPGAGQR